jgi:putative PIN family toxin of toxin-antitoxin system
VRRAVLDTNVFVSALITPTGPSAKLVEEMQTGGLEAIVSPRLLAELEIVLGRQKFRRYFDAVAGQKFVGLLRREAVIALDPDEPAPLRSVDSKDDYLIALAFSQSARLVSGDPDLLELADRAPICSPADLLGAPA